MNLRRILVMTRWGVAACALAGIVLVYKLWLHGNPTSVALSLVFLVLVLATTWGLRYAVVASVASAACFNYFFLPPYGTFTIADTQNWLALAVFLSTSILASRLSQRVRDEAEEAKARQRELDTLFRLSRELLQPDSSMALLSSVPIILSGITGASSSCLYLLEGNRIYQSGGRAPSDAELILFSRMAESLPSAQRKDAVLHIPIRSGVRPRGLLALQDALLSLETADAVGGLLSLAMGRVQALESLARSEAAKESEHLRALMIDSMTHELRTPLTSIKGAASTLLAGEIKTEDRHELLSIIDEESDRMNRLITQAVVMAQLDTHQVQMHLEPVNITDLIEDSLEASAWIRSHHPLQVDVQEGLFVQGDRTFLQKALCNLLENAAKYSPATRPIRVTALQENDRVVISVADQGEGIDPSEQALIFERFYRSKKHVDYIAGTGMGLGITQAILQAHHGEVLLTSQLGRGSVFSLALPILPGGKRSVLS